jgi:endoglucanase
MKHHAFLVLLAVTMLASQLCAQTGLPVIRRSGLVRGVNFGNMLEAPREGQWGLTVMPIFFDKVVEAGMDHIRLPVSWTTHALRTPPYTIDPVFMERVDWCVDQSIARQLKIIVNVHHYDELNADPIAEWQRALAIWDQIAKHFKNRGGRVFFEVLNEPHGVFNDAPELWNLYVRDVLAVIRASNPTRKVLVGPVSWNNYEALSTFDPPNDSYLIATIHNYSPFAFTHQGAGWVTPVPPLGVEWDPAAFTIATPWDNWSWNTKVTSAVDGLRVTYNDGFAGLYMHTDGGITGARALELTIDKAMSLRVNVGNETQSRDYFLQTTAGTKTYTIQLNPEVTPITDVYVQNFTPDPQPEFRVSRVALVIGEEREWLIKLNRILLFNELATAADWANSRRLPLHLGEFGAYGLGDFNSRVQWTKTIRGHTERLNLSWSYWELGAGFGFYDPIADQWRLPLLKALNPQFK